MATKTIGSSGRDYSTVQAWEDAISATITADEIGECYNDTEFSSSAKFLVIGGHTSSFDIKLICHAGQSWSDNANVRTNAKKYNQSNGVAFTSSVTYDEIFQNDQTRFYLDGLQMKGTASPHRVLNSEVGATATVAKYSNLIIQSNNATGAACRIYGTSAKVVNVTVYLTGTSGNAFRLGDSCLAVGCDAVRDSGVSAAGTAFDTFYGTNVLQSSCSFGFTTAAAASAWDTTNSKNCATNLASGFPGSTGHKYNVTYNGTTPFTNAASASLNLIPIAATDLIDNGYLDSTNAPNDCTGTARDSTPTIGSWEVSGGAAATSIPVNRRRFSNNTITVR